MKLRYNVKYWLILLRAKYNKNSSSGFYFPPNLRILGAIFDKKQNNALQQLIFTPMFLKVKRSDFSEIFTRGNYMLEDSFKTRMPFSQALWTKFAITFKTTLFLLYFDTLKIYSWFSRKRSYRFCYNFAMVEATMSSPRSRRRISEIISGGKLFGLM